MNALAWKHCRCLRSVTSPLQLHASCFAPIPPASFPLSHPLPPPPRLQISIVAVIQVVRIAMEYKMQPYEEGSHVFLLATLNVGA